MERISQSPRTVRPQRRFTMQQMKIKALSAIVIGCGLVAATLPALAQQDTSSQPVQPAVSQQDKDKMFVRHASEGGLAEVQFGQLASQKAQNPDVKAFAEKMVHDHTMLNDKMKPVAEQLSVTPASHLNKKDQAEYDKLNGLSGDDFDKEYVSDMVADHRKDLREFRHEAAVAADPQLKQTVSEGAKVIAEHNRMIDALAPKVGVAVPGRPNPTVETPSR
jgi:putative membrane protein